MQVVSKICGLFLLTAVAAVPSVAGVGEREDSLLNRIVPSKQPSDELRRRALAALESGEYKQARRHLRDLAERGDASAETLLGTMRAKGIGGVQDDALAAAWFLRAARRGYAPAQLALGEFFAEGRGVPKDLDQALAYARAAEVQMQPGAKELVAKLEKALAK